MKPLALLPWAIPCLLTIILLGHLILLPAGRWTADEFTLLAPVPDPWGDYLGRVLGWSPRPFSEGLLALYRAAVWALRRPLTVPALAASWLFLGIAMITATAPTRHESPTEPAGLLTGALLLSLVLLAGKPGEAFYWPAAAVAYLPSLAAMLYASIVAARAGGWSGLHAMKPVTRVMLLAWLLIGATSSEIGAAYAVMLGGGAALFASRKNWRTAWVWLPPAAVGAVLLLAFGRVRGQGSDVMAPASPTLHHLAPSLVHALPAYIGEFVHVGWKSGGTIAVVFGVLIRLALLQGLRSPGLMPIRSARRLLEDLVTALALLAAGFASLMSAYLTFGTACCERHATMRQGMFMLALYSVAAVFPISPGKALSARLGKPLLGGALLVLLLVRLPGLLHDLKILPAVVADRSATWKSGLAAGEAMTYIVSPMPHVAGGGWFPPAGQYRLTDGRVDAPDGAEIAHVMTFFGKRSLTVR